MNSSAFNNAFNKFSKGPSKGSYLIWGLLALGGIAALDSYYYGTPFPIQSTSDTTLSNSTSYSVWASKSIVKVST